MNTEANGNTRWAMISNPHSGAQRGREIHDSLMKLEKLKKAQSEGWLEFSLSQFPGHSMELAAKSYARGVRNFICVGGDGTANEIINGCFQNGKCPPQDSISLFLVPVGRGNDWVRSFPRKLTESIALEHLAAEGVQGLKRARVSLGRVNFQNGEGRYFANVAGVGFDAHVLEVTKKINLGPLTYTAGILKGLLTFSPVPMTVQVDTEVIQESAFVTFVGLGKYCGGGMLVFPKSHLSADQLSVKLIEQMKVIEVFRKLPKLFLGGIESDSKVHSSVGTEINIEGPLSLKIETDGEVVGGVPAHFQIFPSAFEICYV